MPTQASHGPSRQTSSGSSDAHASTLTRRSFVAAGLAALGGLVGCASLRPPLRTRAADPRPSLTLAALEGSPEGLLLRIDWRPRDAPHSDDSPLSLVIDRSVDGAAARTIRSQRLDDRLRRMLAEEGIRFRDSGLTAPTDATRRTAYRATLVREASDGAARVARSPVLTIHWPPAPPLPEQPRLDGVSESSVRLSWPSRGFATRVLRRNVLKEAASPKTVATVAAHDDARGRYRDENIEEGDVFAYQIAYGTPLKVSGRPERRMRWGPVSEALYVSVK